MATTFRNQKLFCTCCGGEYQLNYPLAIEEMTKKTEAFEVLHKDCKQTWTEPKADQNQNATTKALWWITNGETGMSSKTMWACLMGQSKFAINHPHDPDDFKRCYKLLQTVPEWKTELYKLKPLSKAWNNLVDNWDKLTAMYEENVKTEWKEYKRIGMYEFMETLIR